MKQICCSFGSRGVQIHVLKALVHYIFVRADVRVSNTFVFYILVDVIRSAEKIEQIVGEVIVTFRDHIIQHFFKCQVRITIGIQFADGTVGVFL